MQDTPVSEQQTDSQSTGTQMLNGTQGQKASETESTGSEIGAPHSLTRKSTSPRTGAKERSKLNAVKHGIFAKLTLLPSESRAEFDTLLSGLQRDFKPQGRLETMLVEKLAVLSWRYRRLLVAEAAEIGVKAQRLLRWEREQREESKANEPFEQGRGLVDRISNPFVFEHCMRLLDAVRTEVQNHGFDSDLVERCLKQVYGTDRPVSLFFYYMTIRALVKAGPKKLDPSTATEYSQTFGDQVRREMHWLRFRERQRRLIEADRLRLEFVRRNVPDSSQLDRLLRYEASLERGFDRTLTQLERLQRMRLGQPVSSPIKVSVSSS